MERVTSKLREYLSHGRLAVGMKSRLGLSSAARRLRPLKVNCYDTLKRLRFAITNERPVSPLFYCSDRRRCERCVPIDQSYSLNFPCLIDHFF